MEEKPKPRRGIDFIGVGVVFFCHDGNGKFVMAKRGENAKDEQGRWDIGGGGVKHGELLEEALRREVLEEYGVNIEKIDFLGFRQVRRVHNGEKTHWMAFDFKCLVDPKKVRLCEPHKFTDLQWFTFASLPKEHERHSQMGVFIENYKDKL